MTSVINTSNNTRCDVSCVVFTLKLTLVLKIYLRKRVTFRPLLVFSAEGKFNKSRHDPIYLDIAVDLNLNMRPYSKMADNDLGLNTWKRGLVGHTSKSGKF